MRDFNPNKYDSLLVKLEQQLTFLSIEQENILKRTEESINICHNSFEKIKKSCIKKYFLRSIGRDTFF